MLSADDGTEEGKKQKKMETRITELRKSNPKAYFIVLVAFFGFFVYVFCAGLFNLASGFGIIGNTSSSIAVIEKMSNFKPRAFEMVGLNGDVYTLIPREEDFAKYKVGDTLTIQYNTLNTKKAYIDNNKHILWSTLFGMIFYAAIFLFILIRSRTRFTSKAP